MPTPELTTLADVKSWLGVIDASQDAAITRMILAAEARIRGLCGNVTSFLTGTYTQTFDGNNAQILWLKHAPVTSITSIVIDGTTLDSTTYTLDAARGAVGFKYPARSTTFSLPGNGALTITGQSYNTPSFGGAYQSVVVTYVGGYANQAAIPYDLQQAAVELAALYYMARDRDPGLQSESHSNYSWTRGDAGDSIAEILPKLGPYLRGSVL